MTPSEIWMEVSDDYNYAKTKISNNCYVAQWIRNKWGIFGIKNS